MKVFADTDIGKMRNMNQDSYYVSESMGLYILADGMGGYTGGEVASQLAVKSVRKYMEENRTRFSQETLPNLLKEATDFANEVIYDSAKENKNLEEMGTTLEICVVYQGTAYMSHIGDSRIYSICHPQITHLTTDHSYVEKLIKDGTITREEAKNHPDKHVLMKALGCMPTVEADILQKKLQPNEILLICSDGLTNMLADPEIKEVVNRNTIDPAKELIERANLAGGYDNITAIVIHT